MDVVRRRRRPKVLLPTVVLLAVLVVVFGVMNSIWDWQNCIHPFCGASTVSVVQDFATVLVGVLVSVRAVWIISTDSREVRDEDRRREDAARGDGVIIPIESALHSTSPTVLALPATFRLRLSWRTTQMVIAMAIVFVCGELGALTSATVNGLAAQGILLGILLFIFGFMWLIARERLVATEDGLSLRRFGATRRIRWTDARLFALIGPHAFELSSPRSILRWACPVDASFHDTVIPLDEYQRQMDSLLLLIAARTGLPLTDLSQMER